ncbi:MAG TPA: TolC family protein [Vicinamibacterales bacterium]|jgi:NodT family efflux transporter outer membrane factor (OMF) lipoprotein|nr:TolC family protein [Vicinamibacterales bacterium]
MRSVRLIGLLGSVVLGGAPLGCAVKQPPSPADALAGVLPGTTAVPPEWRSTTGLAGAVIADWLQTFQDKQLETIVDEALRNNLDLIAASARVDGAAALATGARALLYPHLTATGLAGVSRRDAETRDHSGQILDVSWELDLWGRVRAAGASADARRDATAADALAARQSLAALVATLWYQTIATDRLRATAITAASLYEDLLRLVRARNDVGQVGAQDVALAGADLDRARERERAFAASLQEITRSLEVLLGRYPASEVQLAPDLPSVPPPIPDGLPSELLERRPDLVAAERRVASAFHAVQSAKAARLPRFALTGGGGRSTSELIRLIGAGAGFWRAGIEVFAPLFLGGALQAQVRFATADQEASLALFGQAALRAFSEVESSLGNEPLLADQQRNLEAVLTQDTEALRLGRLRYEAGATDLLHVLQMQRRVLDSQFSLVAIRNDRLANRIALHLALGGGFAAPAP